MTRAASRRAFAASALAASALAACALAAPVHAQDVDGSLVQKVRAGGKARESKAATPPGMQQATPVAIFGDWNVFAAGQGKTRLCYAIAQPQTRTPGTLKRDSAYFFVTVRKAENVQNEIAVMMGFPAKPAGSQAKAGTPPAPGDPTISLGNARFNLVVKDGNAWLQNPGDEARLVTEMSARNPRLFVKATSMRGNATSDEYALGGFAEAMKRTREECK